MQDKKGHAAIKNEATNGLKNKRGTLAMARTNDINSATSQFFVNLVDNDFLDHKPGNYGYAVFGRIDSGMEVVDAIAAVKTATRAVSGRADRDRGHRVGTSRGVTQRNSSVALIRSMSCSPMLSPPTSRNF